MDSQHRHELEQNDLAEALSGFGRFWSKWGNTVLVVVLVIAVSFTVYRYLSLRAEQAHEVAWGDLAFESSPQGLQEIARTHTDPTVKAMAYLRAGDLQLAQALAPAPEEPTTPPAEGETAPPPAPPVDPAAALEDAAGMYALAVEVAPNDTIRSNALLGQAAVAESQRKFDEARSHYEEVIRLAGDAPSILKAQAEARLATLDQLKSPVRFAPAAPAPASAATDAAPETAPVEAAPAATPPAEEAAAAPVPEAPESPAASAAPEAASEAAGETQPAESPAPAPADPADAGAETP